MTLDPPALEQLRGGIVSMIFQEPMLALDPVYTIGEQIAEAVVKHDKVSFTAGRARALEMLERVRIPSAKRRLDNYPHEMSGGMRQRAMIALALSCRPKVLLADEPTTALDATVQIQVLLLLRELQRELGMAVIFVTHDIGGRGRNQRPDFGDVCRADRRERIAASGGEGAGASLYARAAVVDHAWRATRAAAGSHSGLAAATRYRAGRMFFPAAMLSRPTGMRPWGHCFGACRIRPRSTLHQHESDGVTVVARK